LFNIKISEEFNMEAKERLYYLIPIIGYIAITLMMVAVMLNVNATYVFMGWKLDVDLNLDYLINMV